MNSEAEQAQIKSNENKLIHVWGFPKSGNTWLARLLGDVLDSPVKSLRPKPAIASEGENRKGDYWVVQRHDKPPLPMRSIYVVRHPLDVMVSTQHYWKMDNLDAAIDRVLFGRKPGTAYADGWQGHVTNGLKVADCAVSYENLSRNGYGEIRRLVDELEIGHISNVFISAAIKRQSFDSRKKLLEQKGDTLPYGKSLQTLFMRKGVVGDWKNNFTAKQVQYAWDVVGSFAEEIGYSVK